ncbi:hypothetical protein SDC9_64444 [bioreactor metagenome]|uniref:Uncharacterized protein n=1 Tax=bioreactor metagenome TaxID=1076179 RepID=A0A644XUR5_9ZZZZ
MSLLKVSQLNLDVLRTRPYAYDMRGLGLYYIFASPRVQFSEQLFFIERPDVHEQCKGDPWNVTI